MKLTTYSPCEPILDNSQEEQFLVQLTPEKSASPGLQDKTNPRLVERKNNPEVEHIVDNNIEEDPKKAVQVLVDVNEKEVTNPCNGDSRQRNVTPVRKVSKENIQPRVVSQTDVKKVPVRQSLAPRAKLSLRQPATELKKPTSMIRRNQTEVKRPLSSISRPANTPAGSLARQVGSGATPNLKRPAVTGVTGGNAVKTLQFTPRTSKPERRREGPALVAPFKQPSKAVEPQLKKSHTGIKALLGPPRPTTTLRPPTSAASSKSSAQSSSVTSSGLPRSGLVRPALYRSGLCSHYE